MKKLLFLGFMFLTGTVLPQTQMWYYSYNSGGSEEARDIVYGDDGYIYVAGIADLEDYYKIVIIKLNKAGEQEWVYTYGDEEFGEADVEEMLYGDDGNIYVCGFIRNYTGNHKFMVLSISPEGTLRWDYIFDASADYYSEAYSIAFDNGRVYAAGMVDYNFFVAAIHATDGNQQWIYWFDGACPYFSCVDEARAICIGDDGTIYAGGYSTATTDHQIAIVSLTPDGEENWKYLEPAYNVGPSSTTDMVCGKDGRIYVSCYIVDDAGIICLDEDGNLLWKHMVDGPGPEPYYAETINQILYGIDGNIYTVGTTGGRDPRTDSDLDMTVLKFTPEGKLDWFYRYEGLYGFYDIGNAIVQTPDTNLQVAAYVSGPLPEADMFTINHATGRDLYVLRFTGPTIDADVGYGITADEQGYVYFAGYNYTSSNYRDLFTWKVNPPRNSDGYYDLGGNGTAGEGRAIIETKDSCIIIAGRQGISYNAFTDMRLVKTDINGDTLWTRNMGGSKEDAANNVIQCNDNGYLLTGYTSSYGAGGNDLYIVKTDQEGLTEWEKVYGFTANEYGMTAIQMDDGGYLIGATSDKSGNGSDIWLMKIDARGDSLWTRWYGGEKTDNVDEIYRTTDGNYILVGSIGHPEGLGYITNAYVMKLKPDGDTLWTQEFGNHDYYDRGNDIYVFNDGTYLLAGFYQGRNWLAKLDANGDTLWTHKYEGDHWEGFSSMTRKTDGDFVMTSNHITYNMMHFTTVDPQGNVVEDDTLLWAPGYLPNSAAGTAIDVCPNNWGGYMATGKCKISGNIINWNMNLYRKGGELTMLLPVGIREHSFLSQGITSITINAYPNPFASSTTMDFKLGQSEIVSIAILDITGRTIYKEGPARYGQGEHSFIWLPQDDVPTGIYFCRIQAGSTIFSGKLIHTK